MEPTHIHLFIMMCVGVHASSLDVLHRQKRNWIIESFVIDEAYKGPFPHSLGPITVEKNITIFEIHGQGIDQEPTEVLQINKRSGELTVHRPVDYEQHKRFTLTFQAFKENKVLDTQLGIEITIKDSNDNAPTFVPEKYEINVKESKSQGTEVTTVMAIDKDSTKRFKTFDLRIVSVTPKPTDLEFYLTQIPDAETGTISFRGCLDHERAEKYTIIVEAKDHGEIPLSSSCTVIVNIEDGNNHLPVITGQTGSRRVKEGEENVLVSRLQVSDEDSNGTPAWRAKYKIQGDPNNDFKITTDPETNEGLLYVAKQLDYEEGSLRNVTIMVENEIPYYSCKVVSRTASGLWKVDAVDGSATSAAAIGHETSSLRVTVTVEDVNEPPIFDEPYKKVMSAENVAAGKYLETFTAKDYDYKSENKVVYKKGEDPADWVAVCPVTGKVTTTSIIDRESPFVNNSIYEVTIYAVDDGQPPMTGTATLNIYISDQNDNAPSLANTTIQMCQSDGPSSSSITAVDPDGDPYGGPFHFKLLGDVGDKWKVEPEKGYSVNLVKESTVHSEHHELMLEVSDSQGKTAVHGVFITVCNCLDTTRPNCHVHRSTGAKVGLGAFGILLFSILLLAGILLLVLFLSCKRQERPFLHEESEQQLMKSNMEHKGSDCKVVLPNPEFSRNGQQILTTSEVSPQKPFIAAESQGDSTSQNISITEGMFRREDVIRWSRTRQRQNDIHQKMGQRARGHEHRNNMRRIWEHHGKSTYDKVIFQERLHSVLSKMLYKVQAPGEELGHYAPRVYAEEGVAEFDHELDAISMSDISFDPDSYRDMTFQFSTLTSICLPNVTAKYENHLSNV